MRKAVFILLTILIPAISFAQTETILSEGIDKTIEIKHSDNINNNKVLELVARAKSLPQGSAVLKYNIKEYHYIIKTTDKLQLQLSVGHFVFPDNINYLKFNINNLLKPSLISYTYVWEDKDGKIIETSGKKNQKFKNGSYLLNKKVNNTFNSTEFKLYLSDISFGFSNYDVSKLQDFFNSVDAYYDADAQLNMINKGLNMIRTDSLEMLDIWLKQTIDNQTAFDNIRSQRFTSSLNLNASDPIRFKIHFGETEVRNREIKKSLEHTIKNMHVAYYLKGKDWLNRKNTEKAIQFFNKSITEKQTYTPPYYELAKLDFDNKLYKKTIDTCSMVLNKLKPDTDTRYNCVKLAETVIYVYLKDIETLINENKINEAVKKLELCENYAANIPGVKHFSEFDDMHGKLYLQYYNSLVETVDIQIKNEKLQTAQQNIDTITQLRHAHSVYIVNAEKEHILLKNIYAAWINAGKNFTAGNIADSALYAFIQASVVCHKYEVVYCTAELDSLISKAHINEYNYMINQAENLITEQLADSAIQSLKNAEIFRIQNSIEKSNKYDSVFTTARQLKYNELIKIGDESINNNKSHEALAFYNQALLLENNYKIIGDTSLQSKIKFAASDYVILLCIQGETLIEALKIEDAKQKLTNSKNIYNKYKLTDSESSNAINNLNEKLKTGKCNKVQYAYNVQIIAARKFIEQKKFVYAQQALKKAKNISKSDPGCSLSDSIAKQMANNISAMLYYEKEMNVIISKLENKEYANAMTHYNKLTEFYTDSCKNNFGITHKSFYNFIITSKYNGLIDYGVRYYTGISKTDTALILLDILYKKDYIASWAKPSQTDLGIKLAQKDYEQDADTNPKQEVWSYIKDEKWYKYLKKAYLTQWKEYKK
jgi:hypothetical protein